MKQKNKQTHVKIDVEEEKYIEFRKILLEQKISVKKKLTEYIDKEIEEYKNNEEK